jgi:kynurenine 3-monooxygenase
MPNQPQQTIVIGSGLVGSLLSIFLARQGYKVKVFERRPDMRSNRISAGRSINLALSDRGWKALREVGLEEDIRKIAIPMHGRYIHNLDGTHTYQAYGKEGQAIYSVSRGGINCTLMDLAEREENVELFFNQRCSSVDWNEMSVVFKDEVNHYESKQQADLIFGADGAFSAARLHHQLTTDRFDYHQFYIDFGYKELNIPAAEDGSFQMEKNALHIWPRGNYMMIALPNVDGSFTCTLFFPFEGSPSFSELTDKEKVKAFFEEQFADAVPLMPTLLEDFFNNPTSSLVTVKCHPWIKNNRFALIGDAAHAIVPFFGQGMNCGFEDCSVLNSLITQYEHRWDEIFPAYQHLRKPDGDAIADLALQNFIEMRDLVADKQFLLRKKIEAAFHDKHPDKWIPAYSMVTFSPHIRYSEALSRGKRQEKIMDEVMTMQDIEYKFSSPEVEEKILSLLERM